MRIQKFLATAFLAMSVLASATASAETGTVKFWNETKGFGYIKVDGGGDMFFDVYGLIDQVAEESKVQFDIVTEKKGSKMMTAAKNVRLIPPK